MLSLPEGKVSPASESGPSYSRYNGGPSQLLATHGELVALGIGAPYTYGPQVPPTEWISANGRTWQQVILPASVFGQDIVRAVAAGPTGVVAVGVRAGKQPTNKYQPAAWFSPDGRLWRRAVPVGNAFALGEMQSVTATATGFVAVGDMYNPGDELSPSSNLMAVWTSPDGARWQLVSDTSPVFQNAQADVIVRSANGLVVLGEPRQVTNPGATPAVIAWTSQDGRTWQRVPQAPGVFPTGFERIQGAVAGQGRYIAWALSLSGIPYYTVWTSTDGAHWSRAPGIHFQYGGVAAIAPHGSGFVAVGERDGEPALWSSPDGVNWAPAVGEDAFGGGDTQLSGAADWQGGLVVVGSYNHPAPIAPFGYGGPPLTYRPAAWLWRPGRQSQRHPTWARTDPKWFRVRIEDLPAGFRPTEMPLTPSYSYGIGCPQATSAALTAPAAPRVTHPRSAKGAAALCQKAVTALGRSLTLSFRFSYGTGSQGNPQLTPYVTGFAIRTAGAAQARAAFQSAGGLVAAVDTGQAVQPQPVRPLATGKGAELFSVKLPSRCPPAPFSGSCPAVMQGGMAYAAVWWDGPALGVVEAVAVPLDRQALVITLARRQWGRRHALGF